MEKEMLRNNKRYKIYQQGSESRSRKEIEKLLNKRKWKCARYLARRKDNSLYKRFIECCSRNNKLSRKRTD